MKLFPGKNLVDSWCRVDHPDVGPVSASYWDRVWPVDCSDDWADDHENWGEDNANVSAPVSEAESENVNSYCKNDIYGYTQLDPATRQLIQKMFPKGHPELICEEEEGINTLTLDDDKLEIIRYLASCAKNAIIGYCNTGFALCNIDDKVEAAKTAYKNGDYFIVSQIHQKVLNQVCGFLKTYLVSTDLGYLPIQTGIYHKSENRLRRELRAKVAEEIGLVRDWRRVTAEMG
jgi:hypothetical protein